MRESGSQIRNPKSEPTIHPHGHSGIPPWPPSLCSRKCALPASTHDFFGPVEGVAGGSGENLRRDLHRNLCREMANPTKVATKAATEFVCWTTVAAGLRFRISPAYRAANRSLIAGAGTAGWAVICPQLCPRRHTIQNSAAISNRTASRPAQCRSFRTLRACSFVFMPPL